MTAFALYCGNAEPSIDELLNDPIADLLMKRDGIAPREVRALMADARRRRRQHCDPLACFWQRDVSEKLDA